MLYLDMLMKEKNMTRADLSFASSIPESTLRDILNNKTQLDRCEAGTLMLLADALDTSVEDILLNYWEESSKEKAEPGRIMLHDQSLLLNFYSLVNSWLHKLDRSSDISFLRSICEHHYIELFFDAGQYRFALFLLGLTDYLCRKNQMKPFSCFDCYRTGCLDQPVYSLRTLAEDNDLNAYEKAKKYDENHAVPELAKFRIFMTPEDILSGT